MLRIASDDGRLAIPLRTTVFVKEDSAAMRTTVLREWDSSDRCSLCPVSSCTRTSGRCVVEKIGSLTAREAVLCGQDGPVMPVSSVSRKGIRRG